MLLHDLDHQPGIFFVFHDVSVRYKGMYRLSFALVDMGHPNEMPKSDKHPIASLISEEFQVFAAKTFPGMIKPTPITLHLADQCSKIPVRRT